MSVIEFITALLAFVGMIVFISAFLLACTIAKDVHDLNKQKRGR